METESEGSCRTEARLSSPDPSGDMTLIVVKEDNCQSLTVSSKVLCLASPVFAKMLSSSLKEGQQMRLEQHPSITLQDDEPGAMHIILQALHFHYNEVAQSYEPKMLAAVAILCDKYDCNEAMRPWILQWCSHFNEEASSVEYGFLLLAAYFFRSSKLSTIAVAASQRLPIGFDIEWEEHSAFELLPAFVTDSITELATEAIETVLSDIQAVDKELQEQRVVYEMSGLLCHHCGRIHPENAKQCHPCRNKSLVERFCTSDSRVANYFSVLRRASLWPTIDVLNRNESSSSVMEVVSMLRSAESANQHWCSASWDCPLKQQLRLLLIKVQRVLEQPLERTMEAKFRNVGCAALAGKV